VIREGSATLVTGGTIVDAKASRPEANRAMTSQAGSMRTVKPGDIIVTPPGVPHFMRDVKDHIVFMNLVFGEQAQQQK
jgi:mannose-6-phosphate isomerase-like protein (cupin superfamily)